MAFDQLYPWHDRTAFEAKLSGQLNTRQALYCGKYRFGQRSIGNAGVTVGAHFGVNTVWTEFHPELIKAHWLKPFFQILYVFKITHLFRLSQADSEVQTPLWAYPQTERMPHVQPR